MFAAYHVRRGRKGMKQRKTGRKTAKARTARKATRLPTVAAENTTVARLTRERDVALHQQAATAEILKLISSSPADTQPVFDAIVQSGLKLFPGAAIFIALPDGNKLRAAAFAEADPVRAKAWKRRWPVPLTREYFHGVAFLDRKILDIPDGRKAPPELAAGAKNFLPSGYRAVTVMPLMRGRTAIGTLSVVRLAPGKLSDRQVAALRTYADQAVIAIENTRLLNELRHRTDDLSESLEQQTATSEILKVISGTPGELEPVFQAILENATRICEAKFGVLFRTEANGLRCVAMHGAPKAYAEERRRNPVIRPDPPTVLGHAVATKRPAQIADIRDETQSSDMPSGHTGAYIAKLAGARTVLAVPMLKDDELVGVIIIFRQEVRRFTEKQTELLVSFAAQAVIAIENARLLNELRESLEQQTGTADVLKIISRSTFDLQSVLDTLVESAARLCQAKLGLLFRRDEEGLYWGAAYYGYSPEFQAFYESHPIAPGRGTTIGRTALEGKTVHIPDVLADPEYTFLQAQKLGQYRANLGVPLLREGKPIGALSLARSDPLPFTAKQIELVETFADQAVIAIENVRLFNETKEALEQQTATSEVLQVISSSPGQLEPDFNAMLENAVQICAARFGSLVLLESDTYRRAALYNAPAAFLEQQTTNPVRPLSDSPTLTRVAKTKKVTQVSDMLAEHPEEAIARFGKARTVLCVPMLRDDRAVGAFSIYRQEVRPFTDKQIELVKNFASQAVIAIENARLLNELRQRTDDLTESLEQQTATSAVLKVISSTPGELEPVFEAMLENAVRICEAKFGAMYNYENNAFRVVAMHGAAPASFVEARRRHPVVPVIPGTTLGRVAETNQAVQIADVQAEPAYRGSQAHMAGVEMGGLRTVLSVPMLKEGMLIGTFNLFRLEVRPFTDKQIELVKNFAAQAVIAIENARLLNELRQRTDDLTESLEYQTATGDILRVISSSPTDVAPVFSAIAESAVKLCDGQFSFVVRFDGDFMHYGASHGLSEKGLEAFKRATGRRADQETAAGRAILTGAIVQIPDVQQDPNYRTGAIVAQAVAYRSIMGVPLLHEGQTIGAIAVARAPAGLFSERQVALLKTFANQAVIAIENVRLFDEVQKRTDDLSESLEQQTATSDVLRVISSSPGDLEPVFSAILKNAMQVCEARFGFMYRHDGNEWKVMTFQCDVPAYADIVQKAQYGPQSLIGRVASTKQVVQILDLAATQRYVERDPLAVAAVEIGHVRTMLGVPVTKDNEVKNAIFLYRQEVRPFTDKQIDLVKNFAAQAVIAIENARLLNELRQRTGDLSESLEQQTATSEILEVISNSPTDTQPAFDAIVRSGLKLFPDAVVTISLPDRDLIKLGAIGGADEAGVEALRGRFPMPLSHEFITGTGILDRCEIDLADAHKPPKELKVGAQNLLAGGYRAMTVMPMVRGEETIGTLNVVRRNPGPLSDKQ